MQRERSRRVEQGGASDTEETEGENRAWSANAADCVIPAWSNNPMWTTDEPLVVRHARWHEWREGGEWSRVDRVCTGLSSVVMAEHRQRAVWRCGWT